MGSDLGGLLGDDKWGGCFVEAAVEGHIYRSAPPDGDAGTACWLTAGEDAGAAPGVLRKLNELRPLDLPRDPTQLPDVLLYLCSRQERRVAFLRLDAAQLLARGLAFAPSWRVLRPTHSKRVHKVLPSLLISVAFGLAANAASPLPWPPTPSQMPPRGPLKAYELRAHVFLGRQLPPKDDDGNLDAYVRVSLGGVAGRGKDGRLHTSPVSGTRDPAWHETLRLQAWLPTPLHLAPELVVDVWDADGLALGGVVPTDRLIDDFVGTTRLSLRSALRPDGADAAALPPPRWVSLRSRSTHAGSGEVLLMLDLIPLELAPLAVASPALAAKTSPLLPSLEPLPALQPSTRPCLVEVAVLGLRGVRNASVLDPTQMVMGPRQPFVEFELSSPVDAGRTQGTVTGYARTSASNTPSALNPCYLELITLRLALPTNPLFLPALNVRVRDSLFGGLRTPLLGVASISLAHRLPASWRAADLPWQSPREMTVEMWENQRKYPVVGWSSSLLPTDPPRYSTEHGPPFALPARVSELPSQEWSWTSEWQIDRGLFPADSAGWGYAFDFHAAGLPYTLGSEGWADLVRRRRWVRTRVRGDAAAAQLGQVQRLGESRSALPSTQLLELAEVAEADAEIEIDAERVDADSTGGPDASGGLSERSRPRAILTRQGTHGVLQYAKPASRFGATPMLTTRAGSGRDAAAPCKGSLALGQPASPGDEVGDGGKTREIAGTTTTPTPGRPGPRQAQMRQMGEAGAAMIHTTDAAPAVAPVAPTALPPAAAAAWDGWWDDSEDEAVAGGEEEGEWAEARLVREIEETEGRVRALREQQAKLRLAQDALRPTQLAQRAQLSREQAALERRLKGAVANLRALLVALDTEHEEVYMQGRQTQMQELEGLLGELPFEQIAVESGQGESRVQVATLKAVVRLSPLEDDEAGEACREDPIAALREPREYVVRVYVLRGFNLMPMDVGSASDPYLRLRLGKQTLDNRSEHLTDVTTARFHRMFELRTRLPGDSLLQIDCMDHDSFGVVSDDLIGSTAVDLEDRVFSARWRDELAAKPPVEWRALYSPRSKNPQGVLELWVEILSPQDALAVTPWDIAPPPPQAWELRVIVWKAKEVPALDRDGRPLADYSELADLYVAALLEGQGKAAAKAKHTDTHFRARGGGASWNWRFKWPVTMDADSRNQRLTLQLWDRDIAANDYLGQLVLPLDGWFRRVYRRGAMKMQYFDPGSVAEAVPAAGLNLDTLAEVAQTLLSDRQALLGSERDEELEAAKFWLPLANSEREARGALLISLELVPAADVNWWPAGHGRSDPNANPHLPKPVGRLSFTLNPCAMLFRLLGPKLCRQLTGALCCMVGVFLLVLILPTWLGNALWHPFT